MSERIRRASARTLPLVLLADADAGFRAMARDALRGSTAALELATLESGPELLARLNGAQRLRPLLVMLADDLPGEPGGLEAVRAVKCNAQMRRVPVVVVGRGERRETVAAAYDAGANSYIAKPATFLTLVQLMKTFTDYWLGAALLPTGEPSE